MFPSLSTTALLWFTPLESQLPQPVGVSAVLRSAEHIWHTGILVAGISVATSAPERDEYPNTMTSEDCLTAQLIREIPGQSQDRVTYNALVLPSFP